MEQSHILQDLAGSLSTTSGHVRTVGTNVEDLLFRAQHIAHAVKNRRPPSDSEFAFDLKGVRQAVRLLAAEVGEAASHLARVARTVSYEAAATGPAANVQRLSSSIKGSLDTLVGQVKMGRHHMHNAQYGEEAVYLLNDLEAALGQAKAMPSAGQALFTRVTEPPGPGKP